MAKIACATLTGTNRITQAMAVSVGVRPDTHRSINKNIEDVVKHNSSNNTNASIYKNASCGSRADQQKPIDTIEDLTKALLQNTKGKDKDDITQNLLTPYLSKLEVSIAKEQRYIPSDNEFVDVLVTLLNSDNINIALKTNAANIIFSVTTNGYELSESGIKGLSEFLKINKDQNLRVIIGNILCLPMIKPNNTLDIIIDILRIDTVLDMSIKQQLSAVVDNSSFISDVGIDLTQLLAIRDRSQKLTEIISDANFQLSQETITKLENLLLERTSAEITLPLAELPLRVLAIAIKRHNNYISSDSCFGDKLISLLNSDNMSIPVKNEVADIITCFVKRGHNYKLSEKNITELNELLSKNKDKKIVNTVLNLLAPTFAVCNNSETLINYLKNEFILKNHSIANNIINRLSQTLQASDNIPEDVIIKLLEYQKENISIINEVSKICVHMIANSTANLSDEFWVNAVSLSHSKAIIEVVRTYSNSHLLPQSAINWLLQVIEDHSIVIDILANLVSQNISMVDMESNIIDVCEFTNNVLLNQEIPKTTKDKAHKILQYFSNNISTEHIRYQYFNGIIALEEQSKQIIANQNVAENLENFSKRISDIGKITPSCSEALGYCILNNGDNFVKALEVVEGIINNNCRISESLISKLIESALDDDNSDTFCDTLKILTKIIENTYSVLPQNIIKPFILALERGFLADDELKISVPSALNTLMQDTVIMSNLQEDECFKISNNIINLLFDNQQTNEQVQTILAVLNDVNKALDDKIKGKKESGLFSIDSNIQHIRLILKLNRYLVDIDQGNPINSSDLSGLDDICKKLIPIKRREALYIVSQLMQLSDHFNALGDHNVSNICTQNARILLNKACYGQTAINKVRTLINYELLSNKDTELLEEVFSNLETSNDDKVDLIKNILSKHRTNNLALTNYILQRLDLLSSEELNTNSLAQIIFEPTTSQDIKNTLINKLSDTLLHSDTYDLTETLLILNNFVHKNKILPQTSIDNLITALGDDGVGVTYKTQIVNILDKIQVSSPDTMPEFITKSEYQNFILSVQDNFKTILQSAPELLGKYNKLSAAEQKALGRIANELLILGLNTEDLLDAFNRVQEAQDWYKELEYERSLIDDELNNLELTEEEKQNILAVIPNRDYELIYALIKKHLAHANIEDQEQITDILNDLGWEIVTIKNFLEQTKNLSIGKIISYLELANEYEMLDESILSALNHYSKTKCKLDDAIKKSIIAYIIIPTELSEHLQLLIDIHWSLEGILELASLFEKHGPDQDQLECKLNAINVIYDLRINEKVKKAGNVFEIIEKSSQEQWAIRLACLGNVINAASGRDRDREAIFKEIRKRNINNSEIEQIIQYLSSSLKNIDQKYEDKKNWDQGQITNWVSNVKGQSFKEEALYEAIAVIKRANAIYSQEKHGKAQELRDTQIISALCMAEGPGGRLAEIKTGEGKTTIVSVFAIIKALEGKKIDIVTSSPNLAHEGLEDKLGLYEIFGLTAACNNDDKKYTTGVRGCYKENIVYGSISNFQFDLLRDEFELKGTRGDRNFSESIVIVDEVDNMVIDGGGHLAMLAGPTPGMDHLKGLLVSIWDWLDKNFDTNLSSSNNNGLKAKIQETQTYIEGLLKEKYLPQEFKEIAQKQIPIWAMHAVNARYTYEPNVHYLIEKDSKTGQKIISPIDKDNTGIIQGGTTWSDGLHQFLQIKHRLHTTAENFTTSFVSNIGYFNRYGSQNIYGLTGTLGSQGEREFLRTAYNGLDFIYIPEYREKQYLELPPLIVDSEEEWLEQVVSSTKQEAEAGRAILVICESIDHGNKIYDELAKRYQGNIKCYLKNEDQSPAGTIVNPGDIIIATNLAGRGTDIKTSNEVEDKGGLHVCLAFLPNNQRVQDQACGRTARQGKSGTAQLIFQDKEADYNLIKENRNNLEAYRLKHNTEHELKIINTKDALFSEFTKLSKKLIEANIDKDDDHASSNPNPKDRSFLMRITNEKNYKKVIFKNKLRALGDEWGLWLKKFTDENFEDQATMLQRFETEFKQRAVSGTAIKDSAIKNASYLNAEATYLRQQGEFTKSIEILEMALSDGYDKESFITHYNLAISIVENARHTERALFMVATQFTNAIDQWCGAQIISKLLEMAKVPSIAVAPLKFFLTIIDTFANPFAPAKQILKSIAEQIFNKPEEMDGYKDKALSHFNKALKYIDRDIKSLEVQRNIDLIEGEGEEYYRSIESQLLLLNIFKSNIEHNIKIFSDASSDTQVIGITTREYNDIDKLLDDDSLKNDITTVDIQELQTKGLPELAYLGVQYGIPNEIIDRSALMIIGGACCMCIPGLQTNVASGLITEGISDIFFAAIDAIKGGEKFDEEEYWKSKAISLGTSLVTGGLAKLAKMSKVKDLLRSLKAVGKKSIKQGAEAAKKLANKVKPGIIKPKVKVPAKPSVKLPKASKLPKPSNLKPNLARQVVKDIATSTASIIATYLLNEQFMGMLLNALKPKIQEAVYSGLSAGINNQQIEAILIKDNSKVNEFHEIAQNIIFDKGSAIEQIGLGVLRGVLTGMPKLGKKPGVNLLIAIPAIIGYAATGIAQCANYTENFCKDQFNPKIDDIARSVQQKTGIPTSEVKTQIEKVNNNIALMITDKIIEIIKENVTGPAVGLGINKLISKALNPNTRKQNTVASGNTKPGKVINATGNRANNKPIRIGNNASNKGFVPGIIPGKNFGAKSLNKGVIPFSMAKFKGKTNNLPQNIVNKKGDIIPLRKVDRMKPGSLDIRKNIYKNPIVTAKTPIKNTCWIHAAVNKLKMPLHKLGLGNMRLNSRGGNMSQIKTLLCIKGGLNHNNIATEHLTSSDHKHCTDRVKKFMNNNGVDEIIGGLHRQEGVGHAFNINKTKEGNLMVHDTTTNPPTIKPLEQYLQQHNAVSLEVLAHNPNGIPQDVDGDVQMRQPDHNKPFGAVERYSWHLDDNNLPEITSFYSYCNFS